MNWFNQPRLEASDSEMGQTLVIGLVNNTSDRALKSTEAQFLRVLRAASNGDELQMRFFTCPEIPRCERLRASRPYPYTDIAELYDTHVDALIVTGMEPGTSALPDEPVWGSLTKLVDWAEDRGVPTIWSCLAAHAAVLHLDGMSRSPLPEKLSGVFECSAVATDHKLMTGLPHRWVSPHSRYNGIGIEALAAKGYEILAASAEASVDIFMKNRNAPFVFLQGHPEYDGDTLLREYKRDVRRYLAGEKDEYPMVPKHYFAAATEAVLETLRMDALGRRRDLALLDEIASVLRDIVQPDIWHGPAVQLYSNWLNHIVRGSTDSRGGEALSLTAELLAQ